MLVQIAQTLGFFGLPRESTRRLRALLQPALVSSFRVHFGLLLDIALLSCNTTQLGLVRVSALFLLSLVTPLLASPLHFRGRQSSFGVQLGATGRAFGCQGLCEHGGGGRGTGKRQPQTDCARPLLYAAVGGRDERLRAR